MSYVKQQLSAKIQRQERTRRKLLASSNRPRLTVFRSNKHIYAQIIERQHGKVLVEANDRELEQKKTVVKISKAAAVGDLIAAKAKKSKVSQIMFDRGQYTYHGRVKSLAEAARKGGLKF